MNFFKKLFNTAEPQAESISPQHIQLITATLLIEVSKADFSQDPEELAHIKHLLSRHFELSTDDISQLLKEAQQHSDTVTSLQHMTRELNEHISQKDKVKIIELMWRVVYADGKKDPHEEYLIRQVADLLYISHEDFIKTRLKSEKH